MRIRSSSIVTPGGVFDGTLVTDGPRIAAIEPPGPADREAAILIPGLVDLQVNGGWGIDLAKEPGRVSELAALLPRVGVTAWLPTLVSSDPATYGEALSVELEEAGAVPLGWHFEGPWLSPNRAGAHRSEYLTGSPDVLEESWVAPRVRLVTLAPEIGGGRVADLVGRGIVVSIGHTEAVSAEVRRAGEDGASMGTHLFNAMGGLHHRSVGVVGELLVGDYLLGLIVDGHHVAPEIVDLVWRLAARRVVLVSDAMAGLGLPPGTNYLGDYRVVLDGETARLADGTLAGSVISLIQAVRSLMAYTGCSLADAVEAAAARPAALIRDSSRGTIEIDKRADLAILDGERAVEATVIGGEVVYEADR